METITEDGLIELEVNAAAAVGATPEATVLLVAEIRRLRLEIERWESAAKAVEEILGSATGG